MKTALLLFFFAVAGAMCGRAGNPDISEIVAVTGRPMLAVKPAKKAKQTVLLRWDHDEGVWFWTWETATDWEPVPKGVFFNDPDRSGWWIDQKGPRFGRDQTKLLGLAKAVESWRFKAGKWAGTSPAPEVAEPQG